MEDLIIIRKDDLQLLLELADAFYEASGNGNDPSQAEFIAAKERCERRLEEDRE